METAAGEGRGEGRRRAAGMMVAQAFAVHVVRVVRVRVAYRAWTLVEKPNIFTRVHAGGGGGGGEGGGGGGGGGLVS